MARPSTATALWAPTAFLPPSPFGCSTLSRALNPNSLSLARTAPRRQIHMRAGPQTRVAAITGASGGIGEQTSIMLARQLPNLSKLIICCRDVQRGERVAQPLRERRVAGRRIQVDVLPVELMDTTSVTACASAINESLAGAPLDLLICNAGIMACPLAFTQNPGPLGRIEAQFGVNHLSHALLTTRLLPAIQRDAGRVVFVSSLAVSISRARKTAPVVAEKTADVVNQSNYSKWPAYGDSKLAMSLFARALAEKEGVESVSLHPGVVQTELGRYVTPQWLQNVFGKDRGETKLPGFLANAFSAVGFKTPSQGAELSVEVSTADSKDLQNGAMYVNTGLKKAPEAVIPLLHDRREYERVYDDVMKYVETVPQPVEI